MAKIQSKKMHIRQGIHDLTQKNMITKWMLQEEIPLPATSPWHEVPEGVHENVVFPVPIIRRSSLPRKAPPGGEQHASGMLLGSRRLTDEVL